MSALIVDGDTGCLVAADLLEGLVDADLSRSPGEEAERLRELRAGTLIYPIAAGRVGGDME